MNTATNCIEKRKVCPSARACGAAVFLLATAMNLVPTQGLAECSKRLQNELSRVDEIFQRAEERVRSADSVSDEKRAAAQEFLRAGKSLQAQAHENCEAGRERVAVAFTKDAREKALAAVALCNLREENMEIVEQQLRRVDGMLTPPEGRRGGPPPGRVPPRLQKAHGLQGRAWEMFRAGRLPVAMRFSMQAEESLMHRDGLDEQDRPDGAPGRPPDGPPVGPPDGGPHGLGPTEGRMLGQMDALREALNRLERALEGCEIPEAHEAARQAQNAFSLAEESIQARNPREARVALAQCRELTLHARTLCKLDVVSVARIVQLRKESERIVSDGGGGSQKEAIEKLVANARQNLSDGETALNANQNDSAAGFVRAAEILLRQARKILRDEA